MLDSWTLTQDDESMSSARACALALSVHHQRFTEHWPDTAAGDPGSVHQVRVSLRRAQSVLWVGKDVFPKNDLALFTTVVDELLDITSPMRDISVLHDSLDEIETEVSDATATVIPLLHDTLERRYLNHLQELEQWCRSSASQALLKGWRTLSSVYRVGDPDYGKHSYRPIRQIVDTKLKKQNRRVLRDGKAAAKDDNAELWHDLRQEVKQLRYILIGFGGLYSNVDTKRALKSIRRLQNRLGDFQDASTQRLALEQLGANVPPREDLQTYDLSGPLDFQFRVGGLIEHLRHREEDAFDGVLREWGNFKAKAFQREFNRLINE